MQPYLSLALLSALAATALAQPDNVPSAIATILSQAGVTITGISPSQATALQADLEEFGLSIFQDFNSEESAISSEVAAALSTATTTPTKQQLSSIDALFNSFQTGTGDIAPYVTSMAALASPFGIASIEGARLSEFAAQKSAATKAVVEIVQSDLGVTLATVTQATATGSGAMVSSSGSTGGAMPAVTAAPRVVAGAAAAAAAGLVGMAFL